MTTYCLGVFASRLSRLPRDRAQWQALIDAQPEACERGCKSYHSQSYACREVCKGYANVQWKCAGRKE